MILQRTTADILAQLKNVVNELGNEAYSKSLPVLSGNTVGKHVRHIVEFFECMLKGMQTEIIDYDNRQRNLLLETDTAYAAQKLDELTVFIAGIKENQPLEMAFSYAENETTIINTLLYREMAYNIEHTIHHMAIIKIAIAQEFSYIHLPANFGVAYSTVQYQQQCAQ